jgi:hypothetical protein
MLRDGHFIKEEPPKIGAHYTPKTGSAPTPEERLVQDLLLGSTNQQQSFLSRVFGVMLKV